MGVPPAKPPPPEPPGLPEPFGPALGDIPPPVPPPADVIVEKIEFEPSVDAVPILQVDPEAVPPTPPAPTVIGNPVAVTVILFGALGKPSKGEPV
tara:strand:- start:43 stop:327 length:285 start_codon:yes stop_codon:yes gene_type:complete